MLKLTTFVLCLTVGTSLGLQRSNHLLQDTELNFMQLMMNTRFDQRANPERSLDCFDYYLQLFDSISKEYKQSYAACIAEADEDRENIDDSTQPERDLIEASARSSCAALNECTGLSGSIDYFDCFVDSGKENTVSMYEISANASEKLAEVRESYRVIQNNEYRCTNASERAYAEQSYQANLDLQSCLRGEIPVPTAPPTSTTDDQETPVSPDDTTTDGVAPLTTTEESTTDDQETTPAQGDTTTEEPEYSTASTDGQKSTDVATDSTGSSSGEPSDNNPRPTDSLEDLLPEEDLFAKQLNRLANVRAALNKH